jgi:hypothetical protein
VGRPLRPNLVAGGGVFLQLRIAPSDKHSARYPVVVGR